MDYRQRFLDIRDFLKPYQRIWQNEIMLQYPAPLKDYPLHWIEDLVRYQDKADVIRLEKKLVFDYIREPDLIAFYKRIFELIKLPEAQTFPPMQEDHFTWLFVIPKKQHEIRRLAPHLNHLYQRHQIRSVLDIGGGIGLLAQTINNHYGLSVTSLDMDPALQKTGEERQAKNSRHPDNKVIYRNIKVDESASFEELLGGSVMPVGLHTCGKLAVDILKVSANKKTPAIVNFGCCYQKLDASPALQNISEFARASDPLWLNTFALTLSCRAHKKMNDKDYSFKLKVKLFRYAIHILLHDHYGMKDVLTLGNSARKLYDEPFSSYVKEQFSRLKVPLTHSDEALNRFFENPELQQTIREMLAAGLIRNAFGRVLELYLLLDRAIYLEEKGYQVSLEEFFDEELSPRNIGITAELMAVDVEN